MQNRSWKSFIVMAVCLASLIAVLIAVFWFRDPVALQVWRINGKANKVVVIQPFSGFPPAVSEQVYQGLKRVNAHTILRHPLELPRQAYYPARNRYRADSLIRYLRGFGSSDTVIIGLTSKDISTTKGDVSDWGIMGLGYRPGHACVVSTFRLKKADQRSQLYKLALHELGHTQGLPHCPDKTCFMRDAEGGNPLDEEVAFCNKCSAFLMRKGWRLN